MNITQVVVQGTVKPDGTLEVRDPIALPPGEVQVIVQTMPTPMPRKDNALAVLERIWAEREALGMQGRTREQIDADIQSMRDEWEQRQQELARIQDGARRPRE